MMNTSERILNLRRVKKMGQEEFAELCGLSRSSIARYESGKPINRIAAQKISVTFQYRIFLTIKKNLAIFQAGSLTMRLRLSQCIGLFLKMVGMQRNPFYERSLVNTENPPSRWTKLAIHCNDVLFFCGQILHVISFSRFHFDHIVQ